MKRLVVYFSREKVILGVYVLLSIIIGYLVFHDVPTVEMLIGATIVIGAGIFIIWREHALGLERRRAREVTPPTPG